MTISSIGTDGVAQSTKLNWTDGNFPTGNTYTGLPSYPLRSIQHPNGLVESFTYGWVSLLSNSISYPDDGTWYGYHFSSAAFEVPVLTNYNTPRDRGVTRITFQGSGVDESIWIAPNYPVVKSGTTNANPILWTWLQPDHSTMILHYPSSSPSDLTHFRGRRLTHPSGSDSVISSDANRQSTQAYMYATSVVLKAEEIHGVGLPTDVTNYALCNRAPSGQVAPAGTVVDSTTVYDNWFLGSWGNPQGLLPNRSGLPIVAVPTRITTSTPNLPTKQRYLSKFDGYGFTQTDDLTMPPTDPPSVDPRGPISWNSSPQSPSASSASVQTTTLTTWHWDATLGRRLKDSELVTLTGTDLPSLRGGASSVDAKRTTYPTYDSLGRPSPILNQRGDFQAQEDITYYLDQPLVQSSSRSLKDASTTYPANPNIAVPMGQERTYGAAPFFWLGSEREKSDGRYTVYNLRNDLGQITKATDPSGTATDTTYDAWGRIWVVTRGSRGTAGQPDYVGPVVTTYSYDPGGLWYSVKVDADGHSRTTTTTLDAFGRTIRVDYPDSYQIKTYNGFGDMIAESPVIKAGVSHYGDSTSTFDGKGLVIATYDPQGRRLSSRFDPLSPAAIWEPAWDPGQQAVVTKSWDDRGYLRVTLTDLLGQKKAIIDQAGQRSNYFYDLDGHLARTEQDSQVRSYVYNRMGWLLSRSEPEEGTTNYSQFNMQGVPRTITQLGRNGAGNTVCFRQACVTALVDGR